MKTERACSPCKLLRERGSGGWQHTSHPQRLLSVRLLEKGDEVANLDDSSLMQGTERSLLSRGNTRSSLTKDLGALVLAFPHLNPTATSWPGRSVLELAFPHLKSTATRWSERGEGEHVRLGGRRAVAAAVLLRDACSSFIAARRVARGSGA